MKICNWVVIIGLCMTFATAIIAQEAASKGIEVVCVHWTDATGFAGGWSTKADVLAEAPAAIVSCGILIKETDEGTYLAMDKDTSSEEAEYNQTGFIPGKWIIDRQTMTFKGQEE